MDIVIKLINIVLLAVFVLSGLNIIRHLYGFISNLVSVTPDKFELTSKQLLYFGISVALVITLLIKGLTI